MTRTGRTGRRANSLATAGRTVRVLVLTLAIAAIAAATTAVALPSGADSIAVAAALLLVGALALLGLKTAMEAGGEVRRADSELRRALASTDRSAQTGLEASRANTIALRSLSTSLDETRSRLEFELSTQLRGLVDSVESTSRRTDELSASTSTAIDELSASMGRQLDDLRVQTIRAMRRVDNERRARLSQFGALSGGTTSNQVSGPGPGPDEIMQAIKAIESGETPVERISDGFPSEVVGLSGRKFRTLVAEFVRLLGGRGVYLEIGTFHGTTICTSAVLNPGVRHIAVDDFSQVDAEGHNRAILLGLIDQLELSNVEFVEQDFLEFLADRTLSGLRDVAVYFFDASHDYRSQFVALLHGSTQVVDGGVMLVDDCNYSHVRAATYDFCELHPDWALVFERYTEGHPKSVSDDTRGSMREGWWNGVHVLLHDPDHKMERLDRQTDPELRDFFLAQHAPANCHTARVTSRVASRIDAQGPLRGPQQAHSIRTGDHEPSTRDGVGAP